MLIRVLFFRLPYFLWKKLDCFLTLMFSNFTIISLFIVMETPCIQIVTLLGKRNPSEFSLWYWPILLINSIRTA